MSVETTFLDLLYLTKDFSEDCCIMVSMIDEVYTTQWIEKRNGSFVGLTQRSPKSGPRAFLEMFSILTISCKYINVRCNYTKNI